MHWAHWEVRIRQPQQRQLCFKPYGIMLALQNHLFPLAARLLRSLLPQSLSQHFRQHVVPNLVKERDDGSTHVPNMALAVDLLWAFAKLFSVADRY